MFVFFFNSTTFYVDAGQKLGKSFRWFFGKIEGATTPDIVLPLIL